MEKSSNGFISSTGFIYDEHAQFVVWYWDEKTMSYIDPTCHENISLTTVDYKSIDSISNTTGQVWIFVTRRKKVR